MKTLRVSARGRVPLPKNVLVHLGVEHGGTIRIDFLPDGRAELRATHRADCWQQLRGILVNRTNRARLSIEEIDDAIASSGTGVRSARRA